jgi:hypothetical protein
LTNTSITIPLDPQTARAFDSVPAEEKPGAPFKRSLSWDFPPAFQVKFPLAPEEKIRQA